MGIAENIVILRNKYDLTQEELAKIAGVSRSAVTQWERGYSEPRMGVIQKIADHFRIKKSAIIEDGGMADEKFMNQIIYPVPANTTAPVYGRIAAGEALEMIENYERGWVSPDVQQVHPDGFFLMVHGDSMDKVLPDGSLAFIDPSAAVHSGDIAAINVNGFDATIKRVFFAGDTIVLHPESENPEHRDHAIDSTDPDAENVRIIGKLVWYSPVPDVQY